MRIILPALDYSDFLAATLPAWRVMFPEALLVVACGMGDRETQELARAHGGVCVGTTRWTADGAALNKAQVIELLLPCDSEIDEIVIVADADVVPFGCFDASLIQADTLYGCARYRCETPEQLEAHRAGTLPIQGPEPVAQSPEPTTQSLRLIPPRRRGGEPEYGQPITAEEAAAACTGYFQAFRYRPGLTFGSYPTAAGYDTAFRQQFARCVGLTDFYVLHLGELSRENWKGRIVPKWPAGAQA